MKKEKMSKAKGYGMFALLAVGLVLVWASLSSIVTFALACICLYAAFWIYNDHLKKGGISLQEAFAENKSAKEKK